MKILLAVDGSEHSRKAARHIVAHLGWFAEKPQVFLLNVHAPFPLKHAASVVGKGAVTQYQKEESEAALAVAEKVLRDGGVDFHSVWVVGDAAKEIAAYAKANGIDLIVIGSHGHGALYSLALGSVASDILKATDLPVLIVR